jgi:hypothetical protein
MTPRIRIISGRKPLDPERWVAVVVAQALAQLAEAKLREETQGLDDTPGGAETSDA